MTKDEMKARKFLEDLGFLQVSWTKDALMLGLAGSITIDSSILKGKSRECLDVMLISKLEDLNDQLSEEIEKKKLQIRQRSSELPRPNTMGEN